MGHYYDHCESKWVPVDHSRQLTRAERRVLERRAALIEHLLAEVEAPASSIACLYAGLLARTLASSDEILARRCSKAVAESTKRDECNRN